MSGFIFLKEADDSFDGDISFVKLNDNNLSFFEAGDSAFLNMKLAQLENFFMFYSQAIFVPLCNSILRLSSDFSLKAIF